MTTRLSAKTINALPASVKRPAYDRETIGTGIVHLGVGAFHRAHQAVYTDDAIAKEGGDWGIAGFSLRTPNAEERLAPQDGLYIVNARDGGGESPRLIGALKSVQTSPNAPGALIAALAAEATKIVTLTVTEKAYCLDAATGALDIDHPDIKADLENPQAPASAIGLLYAGLAARAEAKASAPAIVCCDNLPSNGEKLRAAVIAFAHAVDPSTADWIEDKVSFPSTMVDRIVPAITDADIDAFSAQAGIEDQGYLLTEPFKQWVIEDKFNGPRPAWEAGGAQLVKDVHPFEMAKLRLLNAPHSAMAYLGYLGGMDYIHEVIADPAYKAFVIKLMEEEIAPTLAEPEGMPLGPYMEALRERFANPCLNHRTWQVAMDGSQKLPQRYPATLRTQLERGGPIERACLAIAGWMRYVSEQDEQGKAIDVRDPLLPRIRTALQGTNTPADKAQALFAIKDIFGDLPENERFVSTVTNSLEALYRDGAAATVKALAGA